MRTYPWLLALLLACSNPTTESPDASVDATPSLPPGITAFAGVDPALPTGDLAPLWGMVGDAHFIGLGEAVHTSGGFYATKERLIEALIDEHGVRVLAMETPRLQTKPLTDFLISATCDTADPTTFMRGMFAVFASDHTVALMRWICKRNLAHPDDPVSFFGFDMQEPVEDRASTFTFLDTYAAPAAASLEAGIATCVATIETTTISAADRTACDTGLAAIDDYVTAHHAALVAAATADGVRLLSLAVAGWRAYQDEIFYEGSDEQKALEARDVMMAHVFDELVAIQPPAGRVAIWAHDYHLSASPTPTGGLGPVTTMGTQLRATHGTDYAPIAITGYRAAINWPSINMVGPTSIGSDPTSLEARLHALASPYLIVDTQSPWLPAGAPMLEGAIGPLVLGDHWAAVVYLDASPGMQAVFW